MRPRFRLDGKVALVTGGGSGIGAATCRAFAEQGARVLVSDINPEGGGRVAGALGEPARFWQTDVTDRSSVEAAVAAAVDRFGRLDVMVNNAGIGLVGSVQEPRGGLIVNIASVAGLIGIARRFAYCTTKGAVIAMTRQLAVDYVKEGIRCNAICPGTVYSPFVEAYMERFHRDTREETIRELHARQPLGRMGRPEEVADLAVYLASDEATFMTGSAVVLDGGWTAL